ncbi:hypothetical protein RNZ50_14535 [Paracoccaceae bacterium Fryx2]|nr:hypothetical protein [Paracoccaceae bacterium Fryx2]
MAQDNLSSKTAAVAADYEALVEQLAAMRDDMAKLAKSVNAAALTRGQALAKDVTEGMSEAADYVARKGHSADVRLEGAVAANPYMALGIAAGVGLLLGALSRR